MTDSLMPDDGNIRVSGGLALVDVNIQVTGNSQTRDFDYLTQNDTDHVLSNVDVNIQMTGNLMPVDGNIRVSGDLTLVDVNTQATGNGLTRDFDYLTQNDTDHVLSIVDVNIQMTGDLMPVDGNIRVSGGLTLVDVNTQTTGNGQNRDNDVACVPAVQCDRHVRDNTQSNTGCGLLPVDGDIQVTGNNGVQIPQSIPKGITKITELTLELFDNNYNLYAQKINHPEEGLFIRAILMKNNTIFFNHTYKIIGTSNVAIATIASADQVCNHYLVHADKGDSFICALGDGHNGVQNYIIRNEHLANFIITLNAIKVKIGLYTIVSGLKSDWLQYASHNTTYQELSLAPDKKSTIPTIESFLNDKWYKSWDDLAGHAQTKYWLPRPDPYLATKLLQMSRKHLGFNIQFFSGHGWWRKHLKTAKLSKSDKCWLCLEDQAVKSPIHIFSECPALAGFRQVLFNDTYPSQHTGQQSWCQVTELALHGSVQELIERTDQNSYVHSTE